MNDKTFSEALLSENTNKIPKEFDWFAPLLGDWDFDYYDGYDGDTVRHVLGEWLFRRILNGCGIEDLFICPSRASLITNPQPDGEYGLAVRMFNKEEKHYDMVYTCEQFTRYLQFKMEDGKLVGTVLDNPSEKWVFCEITDETFHWQNITVLKNGEWIVNANVYGKRKEQNKGA